jgi:hypothetical protein
MRPSEATSRLPNLLVAHVTSEDVLDASTDAGGVLVNTADTMNMRGCHPWPV